MESVTLLSLIEDIQRYKLRYCVLCLRTELQRALVTSPSLKLLLECLSPKETLQWKFSQEEKLVCFVCEARVKTALCVVRSVKFGAKFQKLIEKSIPRPRSLPGILMFPPSVSHLAAECESSVDKIRMRTAIAVTETLCVATKNMEPESSSDVILVEDDPDNINPTVKAEPTNTEESILPDLPRRTYRPIQPKPSDPTGVDNQKKKIKPPKINLQNFINTNTSVKTCNTAANTINTAAVNVPMLSTASVLKSVPVSPMLNVSNNVDPQSGQMLAVQTHDGSYVFHNILQVDGMQYVPTLGAIISDGKLQPISNAIKNITIVSNSSTPTVTNIPPLITKASNSITNVASTVTNVGSKVTNVASKAAANVSNKNNKTRASSILKPVMPNVHANPLPNSRITDMFLKKPLVDANIDSMDDEDDVPLKKLKTNSEKAKINENYFGKDGDVIDIKMEDCIDIDDPLVCDSDQESQMLRPKLKDGVSIDWEDKIPMDVISYMDATDSNIEGNMMTEQNNGIDSNTDTASSPNIDNNTARNTVSPPMGIISSVYSGGECQLATSVLEKILNNDDVISID